MFIPLAAVSVICVGMDAVGSGPMSHETIRQVNGRFFLQINDHLEEIDDITSYCLGCHDGKVGPARQAQVVANQNVAGGCEGAPQYHPVGASYPEGDPEFNSTTMLATGMQNRISFMKCGIRSNCSSACAPPCCGIAWRPTQRPFLMCQCR